MAKPALYDAFGSEITFSAAPPIDNLAELGRVRDPWAGRTTGDITPESLARTLRGDAELSDQMLLQKRMLRDPQIASCMRTLSLAVARLPWEFLPFDDSAEAKRDAKDVTSFFNSLRWLQRLIRFGVYGEFFTFVGAGLKWNLDYGLDGFTPVDPPRWTRDRNLDAIRLKTITAQSKGVAIDPRAFFFHSAAAEPGTPWEAGLWTKLAFPWLFTNATWAYWMRFAEVYGNPFIWAFFARPEDKDSVLEAVTGMAANARGAFPAGTEIKLQEAQRYGTTALYQAVIECGDAAKTKLILGHQLNSDAKGDTGNLAGGAAAEVAQQNKEGVGIGVSESIQEQLVTSWYLFNRGEEQVRRGELATFRLRTDPPENLEKKAKVYVHVNEILASVGKAMDPSQVEDEFAVRTVGVAKVQPSAADSNEDPQRNTPAKKVSMRAAATKKPKISTLDDAGRAQTKLIANACEDFSERIAELFESAPTIEEGIDALWEGYGAMETTRLASGLRDVTVTVDLMGRGDAGE